MTATRQPWDRLPKEPGHWYARFERYRLAGPTRTIEAAYRGDAKGNEGKRPTRHWTDAAKRWRWKQRAEAWDEQQRQKFREVHERDLEAAHRAHAEAGRKLLSKGLDWLQKMPELADALATPLDIVRFIRYGIMAERQALQDQTIEEMEKRLAELEEKVGGSSPSEGTPAGPGPDQ